MKILPNLPLLFFLLIAGSCQDDQDTLPVLILGTWEMVEINEEMEINYVTTYDFREDGTYSHSTIIRESGSDLELGYHSLQTGTFRSEDNEVILVPQEFLLRPYDGEKPYYTREELEPVDLEPNKEYPFNYEIRDNGSTLFLPGGLVGGDVMVPDMSFEKRE